MTDSGAEPSVMNASKSNVQIIYVLHLLGFLTGWITAVVAVVMAYVARPEAEEGLKSHYEFAIRSFWIGFGGSVLAILLACTIILIPVAGLLLLFLTIWWIVRCVQGLDYLGKNQPIPKPDSWMFAT